MTTQETRQLILDIAMNCHRIGGWIADDYDGKKKRIEMFLTQTREYAAKVPGSRTKQLFLSAFEKSIADLTNPAADRSAIAERLMTWGNILTHRAKLI